MNINPNYFLDLSINKTTPDKNILSGSLLKNDFSEQDLLLLKTTWGDSILWSKKYKSANNFLLGSTGAYTLSDNSLIVTGYVKNLNATHFSISRTDSSGNLLWMQQLPVTIAGINYSVNPNSSNEHVFISNNNIYFYINTAGPHNIVGKMDLNGNLLWSKNLISLPFFTTSIVTGLHEQNGSIYLVTNKSKQIIGGVSINFQGIIITKINEYDGSIMESSLIGINPDSFAKGIYGMELNSFPNNKLSISGFICVQLPNGSISPGQSYTRFSLILDTTTNSYQSFYYTCSLPTDQTFQYDVSTPKNSIFLYNNILNRSKYFSVYDSNQFLYRSRKFTFQNNPIISNSIVKLDDKLNIHFLYNYFEGSQNISEYARISDLAPANTLNCFGEDTASIFQQFPMQITKEPFTWDAVQNNVLSSLPINVFTEDFPIQKEVVCKQVSYCDSVKILGNPVACISGGDVRFSSFLNPQCLKSLNWSFDTSYASVVHAEADSAVTLRFKQSGQFYLKAEVNNCVVKDSVLVTVTSPKSSLQLNKKDSVLCPGDSILLQAGTGFANYQWQDGSTQNFYTVKSPGFYRITATDSCGNIFKDSLLVSAADTSLNIATVYPICPYDSAKLLFPSVIYNITWQPAASGLLTGNVLKLFPPQSTSYLIQAQKSPGCDVSKTIEVVKEDCPEWVRFPSAFTPNNDRLNDLFKPGVSGQLQSYTLKVFERNGQLLFSTNNPYAGWNGNFKGVLQNSGVFVFVCQYNFYGKETQLAKGTVALIR